MRGDDLGTADRVAWQSGVSPSIPALDESGRETYLEHDAIRAMEGMDPISGLWRVRARDGRTALRITGGNKTQAAKLLGIDVRTVARKLDRREGAEEDAVSPEGD